MKNLTIVATITSPHGIKGAVKIKSYTQNPESIGDYSPLCGKGGEGEYNIKILSVKKDILIAKVDGVDSRNQAEELKNIDLYADRELFEQPEEDEFFYEDLMGMDVVTDKGEKFGKVLRVDNYGAGDFLEIKLDETEKSELFAFTKNAFPRIDVENNKITINPPEVEYIEESSGS